MTSETHANLNEKLHHSRESPKCEREEVNQKPQIDTKFSWLMVFAGFLVHCVIFGTISAFGIYLAVYLKTDFADQPRSLMSLVGGMGPAIYALCSLPSGLLFSKVGHRVNIISGGIIIGVGLVIASFSTQLWHLFIGQALFVGIAASLCFIPVVSIVPQWFDKYRGLAVGLTASGSGAGGLVLAPVVQAIIDSLGWRWALRINAIVGAVILISCGFIIRPRVPFQPPKKFFETEIITNPKFIAMWAMGMASCFAYWTPFFLMPLYCTYHGIGPGTASVIVGILNGAAAVGRIATGKLADRIGNVNTLIISNFICSLTFVLIWQFATVTWSLILFVIIFGIFSGAFFTNSALLAPQLFGMQKLAQVNGPYYTCCAPGFMSGTVIATAIVTQYTTGAFVDYLPCQLYLFGCYIASCGFLLCLRWQLTKEWIVKV